MSRSVLSYAPNNQILVPMHVLCGDPGTAPGHRSSDIRDLKKLLYHYQRN